MLKWFQDIDRQLGEISQGQLDEPTNKIPKGAIKIGVVPEDLRPLFSLWHRTERLAQLRNLEVDWDSSDIASRALMSRAIELQRKSEVYKDMFFLALHDALAGAPHLWENGSTLYLCENWQVALERPDRNKKLKGDSGMIVVEMVGPANLPPGVREKIAEIIQRTLEQE